MTGAQMIASERQRQQRKLGWSKKHDQTFHTAGELAEMGAYLASPTLPVGTMFNYHRVKVVSHLGWNITSHSRINELVKAGALIAAEIDRLLANEENPAKK